MNNSSITVHLPGDFTLEAFNALNPYLAPKRQIDVIVSALMVSNDINKEFRNRGLRGNISHLSK